MSEGPRERDPRELEPRLNYRFQDGALLKQALTHRSLRRDCEPSNERLEFLGDAILGAVISEHLFSRCPEFQEGQLTRVRADVVSRQSLARAAERLEVAPWLRVSRMFAAPADISKSILSNAYEAIIGAIFLDGGFEAARGFVLSELGPALARAIRDAAGQDDKSALGQWAQSRRERPPVYEVMSLAGKDHERTFEVRARVGERVFAEGYGRSKQEAEQRAAAAALRELGLVPECESIPGIPPSDSDAARS